MEAWSEGAVALRYTLSGGVTVLVAPLVRLFSYHPPQLTTHLTDHRIKKKRWDKKAEVDGAEFHG